MTTPAPQDPSPNTFEDLLEVILRQALITGTQDRLSITLDFAREKLLQAHKRAVQAEILEWRRFEVINANLVAKTEGQDMLEYFDKRLKSINRLKALKEENV